MSFYRPISRDYEYLGAKLRNTRNSWGAYTIDLSHVVMTTWSDFVSEDGSEVIVLGPDWSKTRDGRIPAGYGEHLEHLEAIEGGLPFYILIATDKAVAKGGKHNDDARSVDPRTPRRCFKGVGLVRRGEYTYALLGEEVSLNDAQLKFIAAYRENVSAYNRERLARLGIEKAPVVTHEVIEAFERNHPKRDPSAPARVYVIRQDGGGDHFKVGWSTDPSKRLATLQTGNPYKLELWAESHEIPALEAEAWERDVHAKLPERMMGEWFDRKSLDRASAIVQSIEGDLLFESELAERMAPTAAQPGGFDDSTLRSSCVR